MNFRNRQQVLIVLAIGAAALLAADRFVLTPLTNSWAKRTKEIAALRKEVSQGSLLLDRERNVRSRWEQMRTHTLSGDASVAENQVLKAFDRWSQESRISISSIKPQWKRNAEDFLTLECRVDSFGSLATLTRFLYNIENDPLGLKVEGLEISARDNTGSQLSLGLTVSALFLLTDKN